MSAYAIWIVIFAFYLFEHVKRVPSDFVLTSYASNGMHDIWMSSVPFTMNDKQVVVVPPFTTGRTFTFGLMDPTSVALPLYRGLEIGKIKLLHSELVPFYRLEPIVGAFYFGVLPLLTYAYGLEVAVLVFFPVQIVILIYVWSCLWRFEGTRGDKKVCRICLALEMIVVPGIIPALSKRLALRHSMKRDAPHMIWGFLSARRKTLILDVIQFRLTVLLTNSEVSGSEATLYLKGLGPVR